MNRSNSEELLAEFEHCSAKIVKLNIDRREYSLSLRGGQGDDWLLVEILLDWNWIDFV